MALVEISASPYRWRPDSVRGAERWTEASFEIALMTPTSSAWVNTKLGIDWILTAYWVYRVDSGWQRVPV